MINVESNEEMVGTYFGKNLYRKIIHLSSGTTTGDVVIGNIDSQYSVISIHGGLKLGGKNYLAVPFVTPKFYYNVYVKPNGEVCTEVNGLSGVNTIEDVNIIIEYTKA